MDIYHTMFLRARNEKLHDAPIALPVNDQTRIMDVGTGTGIWAIDMAESVSSAQAPLQKDLTDVDPAVTTGTPKWVATLWNKSERTADLRNR